MEIIDFLKSVTLIRSSKLFVLKMARLFTRMVGQQFQTPPFSPKNTSSLHFVL